MSSPTRKPHAFDQLGLVHRDIKPANCLLTGDGSLKVTDFAGNERKRNVAPAASALLLLLDRLHSLRGVVALGAYAKRVWEEAARRDQTADTGQRLGGLAYHHSAHPAGSRTVDLRRAYRRAAEIAAMD